MDVSLRAVAKHAGVSPSTASRALNGHPQVNAETRQRVMQSATELGYEATNRSRQENRLIALIIPHVSSPFYCAILQGVEKEAFARGYDLVLYTTEGRTQRNVAERVAASGYISGVVVVTPRYGEDEDLRQISADTPVVVVDHRAEGSGFPHVTVDNLRASHEATKYLLKKGHRRIGFITGPLEIESAMDRLRGYRLALEEAGIGYDERLVREGDFTQPTGYSLTRQWISDGNLPDALYLSNDLMAVGAVSALREAGLVVGSDIGVMGFDDLDIAQLTTPPLTTVRQPIREMGETAIRMLLRLLDGNELETNKTVLQTELVVRDSA